jgi:glutamate-1-semialdehyde 2,1-aminomutase
MFGFFFSNEKHITRYEQVTQCDINAFKHFFHAMLDEGVYLAPSAYEAGFVSSVHTDTLIDESIAAAARAFATLKK